MRKHFRTKRQHTVERVRPDGTREVTETRAQTLEQANRKPMTGVDPADSKVIVVGPPGCCCISEHPALKQPRRTSGSSRS